jgi:hypothetical protein
LALTTKKLWTRDTRLWEFYCYRRYFGFAPTKSAPLPTLGKDFSEKMVSKEIGLGFFSDAARAEMLWGPRESQLVLIR